MVNFGESLKEARQEEWRYAYLSYESLKEQLELIIAAAADEANKGKVDKIRPLKIMFERHLESEIVKILEFYSVMLESVRAEEKECSRVQEEIMPKIHQDSELSTELRLALIESQRAQWRGLANAAVSLLEYISLNMQALRKIVKKHSKNVEPLLPSKDIGATRVIEILHPDEPGQKLIQATFLSDDYIELLTKMQHHHELQNICSSIRESLEELQYRASQIDGSTPVSISGDASETSSLERRPSLLGAEVGRRSGGQMRRSRSLVVWKKSMGNIQEYEPVLIKLEEAAASAQRNASLVSVPDDWFSNQAAIFTAPPKDEEAVATKLGLFMNFLSAFLYMANYNLVIPFIRPLSEKIGVSESFGGIMVGAADISAMIAAVFYSVWSNHSFRQPMVFTAVTLIVSNAMYSIAYDWGGLPLLMTARLITGFGAARSLNRRYIADFVKKEKRSLASAAFVGASSLGMALGPFLAIPVDAVKETTVLGLTINNVTTAGWVMCLAWVVFLIVTIVFFAEPPRKDFGLSKKSTAEEPAASIEQLGGSKFLDGELEGKNDQIEEKPRFNFWKDPSFHPTMVMVVLLFMLKLEQQGAVSSVPIFTEEYGWGESRVGFFLAIMGIVVIPVNIMMGAMSKYVRDHVQCLLALVVCTLGSLLIVVPNVNAVKIVTWRYFTGFIMIYVATVVMEGAAMSLMSKVIAPEMAVGTFNAGLLATDSGSFGRFIGNLGMTLIGRAVGIGEGAPRQQSERRTTFGNISYGTYAFVSFGTALLVVLSYKKLKRAS
ncbi:hypothetical protein BSKO_03264 [Bryopsis sp. KO-2023]|nr:hypothetical protein BSKO_03264 [Bryopsis sp. KO-2023]